MKITKTPKKLLPAAPEVDRLLEKVASSSDDELPLVLDSISEWCWPRGDLHYWTQTLNRFDSILEETCKDYQLKDSSSNPPVTANGTAFSSIQINEFTPNRKRLLVSVLRFSRLLIENCTNRKLYSSYEHLNDLLFTRDLDVLEAALRLILRPAQNYSSGSSSRHEWRISNDRLSTLAVTWPPREHGTTLTDVANPDLVVPNELKSVRFQFYRRAGSGSGASGAETDAAVPSGSAVEEGGNPSSFNTPVRPRGRDGRSNVIETSSSASNLNTPLAGSSNPNASTSTSNQQEGITTIELGNVSELGKSSVDILADAIEQHSIPKEDQFELFQKIRIAMGLSDPQTRKQLLVVRLLAVACYSHVVPESLANTQLFLYEPDVVQRTASLADPSKKLNEPIQSAAFYALDGLGRYRSKLTEVLNSVNASVNHGILLHFLKNVIDDLATDSPQSGDHLVDALFGFIAFITSTATGSSMIVNAGLIPLLVQVLEIGKPDTYMVQRTISRAIGLVDSVLYAFPTSFSLFCNAKGLDILVGRIEEEVNRDIKDAQEQMEDSGQPSADNLYGKLAFGRASLLRNMLKSISHMMSSTGTSEGLRNLIDGSLPKSVQKMMENRRVFGPQIVALSINIMATFIHNEPTALTIIQELKLPETFFDLVECDIESNYEVIIAIPNAIGALCLNQAGLDLVNSKPLYPKLFDLFTSERHIKVLQDRDNASMIGQSIDELIRHQPSMKQSVMDQIFVTMEKIKKAGEEFKPTQDEEKNYRLKLTELTPSADQASVAPTTSTSTSTGDAVMTDVSGSSAAAGDNRAQEPVPIADVITDEVENSRKPPVIADNPVVAFMDITARFLEGLFQTTSHWKDFLKADGLTKLLKFYSLPCLPYNFSNSMAADSLATLIRLMTEVSSQSVITAMLVDLKESVAETKSVWDWDAPSPNSQLLHLITPTSDEDLEKGNKILSRLISLRSRTQVLADICQTFAYVGTKMPTTFLQTLNGSSSTTAAATVTVEELGEVHRACVWEKILLKAAEPAAPSAPTGDVKGKGRADDVGAGAQQQPPSSDPASLHDSSLSVGPGTPADILESLPDASTPSGQVGAQENSTPISNRAAGPQDQNRQLLRHIISSIPSSLNMFFQETSKILIGRRTTDTAHKKASSQTSESLASMLCKSLEWKGSAVQAHNFAYATIMIGRAMSLLWDERSSGVSHLNLLILLPFEKKGGLDLLFSVYRNYSEEVSKHSDGTTVVSSPKDPSDRLLLGHACGGLKVALNLLQNLVTSTGYFGSSYLNHLTNPEDSANQNPETTFEPHSYLVHIRSLVFPVLKETWESSWLPGLPLSVNRSAIQTVLQILNADPEIVKKKPQPASASMGPFGLGVGGSGAGAGLGSLFSSLAGPLAAGPPGARAPRAPTQPDEERITQLMEMGFPRGPSTFALRRTANNTSAAAEFLLTNPQVVAEYDTGNAASNASSTPAETNASGSGGGEGSSSNANAEGSSSEAPVAASSGADVNMEDATGLTNAEAAAENVETTTVSPSPPAADGKSKEEADAAKKAALDQGREKIRENLTKRTLELADFHEDLVFDARAAFALVSTDSQKTKVGILSLIEQLRAAYPREGASTLAVPSLPHVESKAESILCVRLRLLALLLHDNDANVLKHMDQETITAIASAVTHLLPGLWDKSQPSRWFSSTLLVASAVLGLEEDTTEVKAKSKEDPSASEEAEPSATKTSYLGWETNALQSQSLEWLKKVADSPLERDSLLALYRLVMLTTRRPVCAEKFVKDGGIPAMFKPFLTDSPKDVAGCQVYVILILRHVIEDKENLQLTMNQEVKSWLNSAANPRSKIDTSTVIRSLQQTSLRNPNAFLKASAAEMEMFDYNSITGSGLVRAIQSSTEGDINSKEGSIKHPAPAADVGDETMEMPASPTKVTFSTAPQELDSHMADATKPAAATSETLDTVMQFLLTELLRVSKESEAAAALKKATSSTETNPTSSEPDQGSKVEGNATEAPKSGEAASMTAEEKEKEKSSGDGDGAYLYTSFIMQCLTELLSSYSCCKSSFTSFTRKRLFGNVKDFSAATPVKPRGSGVLGFFLAELVPMGFLQSYEQAELRKRMAQSNWAMSVIVALSADVTIHTDIKEVAPELANVRRFVLDGIAKAIKDASTASEPIEIRYGRLYALADLCYRLLTARPNGGSGSAKQVEDLTLHMAKTMLEKNFVTILTGALADVDLNLPSVKTLLDGILRPLEHLTKVAIKMGKAERVADKAKAALSSRGAHHPLDFSDEDDESTDYGSMDDEEELDEDGNIAGTGREATPDFYRNSSLGMHTGEMESIHDPDDSDDDMDEDEDDVEMEEYSSGSDRSDASDESSTEGMSVVEVIDENDEDDEDGDDEDEDMDGIEDEDMDDDDPEAEWFDEDDEDDEGSAGDIEALDFVLGDGDPPQDMIDGLVEAGLDEDGEHAMHVLASEDEDDEGDDQDDDQGSEDEAGFYENEELAQLELAEDQLVAGGNQPEDRFGANWGWTARGAGDAPLPRGSIGGGMPPSFFFGSPAGEPVQAGAARRHRLVDPDGNFMFASAPRRQSAVVTEDIPSHPLLVDQSQGAGHGGDPRSVNRSRRGPGGNSYQEWVQSIEDLVGGGAMQFLEQLLGRPGGGGPAANQGDFRIELTAQGQDGAPVQLNRLLEGGRLPGMSRRNSRREPMERQQAARSDPVAAVQEFIPMSTSTRWAEESRVVHGALVTERATRLRHHLVNALLPSLKRKQEADRIAAEKKEKEKAETKKKLDEALKQREEAERKLKESEILLQEARKEESSFRQQLEEAQAAQKKRAEVEEEAASAAAQAPQVTSESTQGPQQSSDEDVEMSDAQENVDAPSADPSSTGDSQPNIELESLQQGIANLDEPSGSSSTPASNSNEASGSSEAPAQTAAPRIMTTINGNQVDITDTGIDPEFLEALPDDMREEVLNQHFREKRQSAAAPAPAPSETNIEPEFLDALPPEIRAEVLQQEQAEAQRRQRQEEITRARAEGRDAAANSANANGSGGTGTGTAPAAQPAQAEEMDPASFIASLEPALRDAVLMDQDDGFLEGLPGSYADEIRDQRRQQRRTEEARRRQQANGGSSSAPRAGGSGAQQAESSANAAKKLPARDAIQLLDKSGVATLVRLLFFPQMNSKQTGLHKVLGNLSENSKTRGELLSLLLMILSDGITDANAVDKSYASMSLRASKLIGASGSSANTPTRPTPKRNNSTPGIRQDLGAASATLDRAPLSRAGDEAPFLIASRSIECLHSLTHGNEQAAQYFLREDVRPEKKVKGKGKEKVDKSNAPVNVLLALLGKDSILANSQLVDALLALLNIVTKPLTSIPAPAAESEEDKKKAAESSQPPSSSVGEPLSSSHGQTGEASGSSVAGGATASNENKPAPALTPAVAADSVGLTVAPHISAERLAAVVRPLSTAISSKGFQNTLSVAAQLSTIPGGRDIISDALRREAEEASRSLASDLDRLLESLPMPSAALDEAEEDSKNKNAGASTGEDNEMQTDGQVQRAPVGAAQTQAQQQQSRIQSPALSALASPSNAQAVLLRSLRALDYIVTGR